MKRILAILCMALAAPALAQTFPVPTDIAAFSGSTGWSQVVPLYKTDGTANTTIDPTVTPMPVGTGLTNVPISSSTGRISTFTALNELTSTSYELTNIHGGPGGEAKFRSQADFSFMAPDDPIRNFGLPGSSHLHCFFGGGSTNAFSTYATLRAHGLESRASGTDANATAYWIPCTTRLDPYGNGKNYAIKFDLVTLYYTLPPTEGERSVHSPTGLRYVLGFDMDSLNPTPASASNLTGQYAWLWTYLATANAAQGYARYSLTDSNGRMSVTPYWICSGGTIADIADRAGVGAKYLKRPDGGDPWGGTCTTGNDMYTRIDGPSCYDGTNLWSPGGYKHLIPAVYDSVAGNFVCPYNYYRIAGLTLEFHYQNYGPTDYMNWVQSSDLSYRTARGLTSAQVPPGLTFHTDWSDGWDRTIRTIWENNCIGVEHQNSHTCSSSIMSSTQKLIGENNEAGVVRTKQVDTSAELRTTESGSGWMLIPPAWSGSLTGMHLHN